MLDLTSYVPPSTFPNALQGNHQNFCRYERPRGGVSITLARCRFTSRARLCFDPHDRFPVQLIAVSAETVATFVYEASFCGLVESAISTK